MAGKEDARRLALANPIEKVAIDVRDKLDQMMSKLVKENDALVTRFLDDTEFRKIASGAMSSMPSSAAPPATSGTARRTACESRPYNVEEATGELDR